MPIHYTAEQATKLAQSLLDMYSRKVLLDAYNAFKWRDQTLPIAWTSRALLTPPLIAALKEHDSDKLIGPANAIYRWGFRKPIPEQLKAQPGLFTTLLDTLQAFAGSEPDDVANREARLTALLGFTGLGISVASKWVCFVDPNRYGIYDSRVSTALRNMLIDGHRAFPLVPRRKQIGKTAFPADTQVVGNPIRIARAYLDYLNVLANVADRIEGLCTAKIEMALFMLGDVWANNHPPLNPLYNNMWN